MDTTQNLVKLTPIAGKLIAGEGKGVIEFAGGPGGVPFDDAPFIFGPHPYVNEIRIKTGTFVDAIHLILGNGAGGFYELPIHGGPNGIFQSLALANGETLVEVTVGSTGQFIDFISFTTSTGRNLIGGTNKGGDLVIFHGSNILGFRGRAGSFIDAITSLVGFR